MKRLNNDAYTIAREIGKIGKNSPTIVSHYLYWIFKSIEMGDDRISSLLHVITYFLK